MLSLRRTDLLRFLADSGSLPLAMIEVDFRIAAHVGLNSLTLGLLRSVEDASHIS